MKYLVFITLFALAPFSLLAQRGTCEIGFGGGANMTSLHGDNLKHYFDWQYSAMASLQVKYSFTDVISLVGNLSYETKGSKGQNLKLLDAEGKSLGSIYDFRFTYDYITIPVLLRYSSKRNHFFVNAGPYLGYLLKYTESYYDLDLDRTYDMQQTDFGVSIGGGLSYPISDQWNISFELRNNLGLTNVRSGDEAYSKISVRPAVDLKTIKTNSTNFLVMLNYTL